MNAATVAIARKDGKKSNKNTSLNSRKSSRPVPELLLNLAYYLHATKVIGVSKVPNALSPKARSSSR